MRRSKDYYVLLAVTVICPVLGFLSSSWYFGLMWVSMGFVLLCWGRYYFKGGEVFDIGLSIGRRNMEYYDIQKMMGDIGKQLIRLGIFWIVCGASAFLVDFFTADIMLVAKAVLMLTMAALAAMAAFAVICRKSKYLKDPSVTPPKRGIIRASK